VEISNLVVARYIDGRVLKGITNDFSPNRAIFHIDPQDGGMAVEVRFRHLKALFFVASLQGDSSREDVRGFVRGPAETPEGKKIAVRFRDGELMCGYTLTWSPEREGFFIFPADAHANNQRVFILSAATAEIKAGPAAEALAQRVLSQSPDAAEAARPKGAATRPFPEPPYGNRGYGGTLPRPPHAGERDRPTGSD